MSDDLIDPESGADSGERDGGAASTPSGVSPAGAAAGALACLSCGAAIGGIFCSSCGQKNDDLRRSSWLLALDFLRDTFGFDSRMWRTLGLLAVSPGFVPKNYAHGRRSKYTPPVRLFLVVSFLFFLIVGLTNTLFIGLDVRFGESTGSGAVINANLGDRNPECQFLGQLVFFVRESDLNTDKERLARCLKLAQDAISEEIDKASDPSAADPLTADKIDEARTIAERAVNGIDWVVANPQAFNNAFNDWLPRIMFLMTPVLALILSLFLRGRDALFFDHLILSFYTHAAAFALTGLGLLAGQGGLPYAGPAAAIAIAVYYLAAIKRAYGRGWIKTIWTTAASGALYLAILMSIVFTIVSNVVLRAIA